LNKQWLPLFKGFQWRPVLAKYCLKVRLMDDYLMDFIHVFAMYREVYEEDIGTLVDLLYELLSITNKYQEFGSPLLPPNLSGMVHNLSVKNEPYNWRKYLSGFPDYIEVSGKGKKIKYVGPFMTKKRAKEELQYIIVEGIFIYFLAKFCHGPVFKIKMEYYRTAEPIHTLLTSVLDKHSVFGSLRNYFIMMDEVFKFNSTDDELRLVTDYWSVKNERFLTQYLPIAQKPKIKEYWCLNAKFEKVFDDKAIVTFSLPFEADPRANLQKAVLAREDLLCKVDKQNGGLLINVVLQKNLAFNCDWRCTDAWYPDSSLLGLEGRFMKNTIIAHFPDGIKRKMPVRREILVVSDPDVVDRPIDVLFDAEPILESEEYRPSLVWDKGTARPTKEDILASGLVQDIDAMLKNEDEIEPTESYRDDDGNDLPPEILFNLNSVMTEPLFLINKNNFNYICQRIGIEDTDVRDNLRKSFEKQSRFEMAYLLAKEKVKSVQAQN